MDQDESWEKCFRQYCEIKTAGGDPRELLERYAEEASTASDRHYALTLLASEYRSQGDVNAAEKALRSCIDLFPDDAASWLALARLLAEGRCDYEGSLECAETAVSSQTNLSTTFLFAHCGRMEIAILANRADIAEDSLRKIVQFTGEFTDWQLNKDLVRGLERLGLDSALVDSYRRLVQDLPALHCKYADTDKQ